MKNSVIHVKVPGKLFVAGEYAVLEPDQTAIVIAVDRYINGSIEEDTQYTLSLPQLGYPELHFQINNNEVVFDIEDEKFIFVKNALSLFYQLLLEKGIHPNPFRLTVMSELDDNSGKKFGLGSSAAIVVTVMTALLNFYRNEKLIPKKEFIYKLSAIVHYQTQGNGSCADIAASTYGGWLSYQMFCPEWLLGEIQKGTSLTELLHKEWPRLHIHSLKPPKKLSLAVGWTKQSAKTAPMVKNIQKLGHNNRGVYETFLQKSKHAVMLIIESFQHNDLKGAIAGMRQNRLAIQELGQKLNVPIETDELKKLIEVANNYGSGKSSGAGGGDCGIAFIEDKAFLDQLFAEWEKLDILPLPLHVSELGAMPSE